MRKIIVFLFLFISANLVAQDIITSPDGKVYSVKIIDDSGKKLKFYELDDPAKKIKTVNKSQIFSYKKGDSEKTITGNPFKQDCKYERNEIDKFTKQTILETKYTALWMNIMYSMAFKAGKINNSKYLEMSYSTSSIYSINKGSELMFLMDNDSIIKLTAIESKVADYSTSKYGTIWYASVAYTLLESDYKMLLNGAIKSIRFYTPKGYIEKQIKKNRSKYLYTILKCI